MASTITLERDGHDQPWGFRLQGGVDVGIPLSVQRVLVGTPAEGVLLKGDVITKISQTDAKNLTHQQAADLFNNAGNQIAVSIKRSGHSGGAVPVVNGTSSTTSAVPASPPVSGGVALPGLVTLSTARSSDNPALASLPQTQFMLKSDLPTPTKEPTANLEALSIQNQPYRTTPLITPGAKVKAEIGTGSMQHLKMQEDHITGVKEPQYVPVPQSVVRNQKANEILMKQKVRRPATTFLQGWQGWRGLDLGGGGAELKKVRRHTISTASPVKMLERQHNRSGRNEFVKYGENKYMVFGEIVELKRVAFPVGEKVNKKESIRKFSSPANFPSLQRRKVSKVKPLPPPIPRPTVAPRPVKENFVPDLVMDKIITHPPEEKVIPLPVKENITAPLIEEKVIPTPIEDKVTPRPVNEKVTPRPVNEKVTPRPVNEKVTPLPVNEKVTSPTITDKVMICPVEDKVTPCKIEDEIIPYSIEDEFVKLEAKKEKFAEMELLGTARYEELEPDSKTIFRIFDDERHNLDYLVDANCKNQDAEFTYILPSCAKTSPDNKHINNVEVVGNICIRV